jgi:hypothetical protein
MQSNSRLPKTLTLPKIFFYTLTLTLYFMSFKKLSTILAPSISEVEQTVFNLKAVFADVAKSNKEAKELVEQAKKANFHLKKKWENS